MTDPNSSPPRGSSAVAAKLEPPPAHLKIRRRGEGLLITARFPTSAHLLQTTLASLPLCAGLCLAAFAHADVQVPAPAAGWTTSTTLVVALVLALYGWRQLQAVQPYGLLVDQLGLLTALPQGVHPLPATGSAPARRQKLTWRDLHTVALHGDGLSLSRAVDAGSPTAASRTVLIPWRCQYRTPMLRLVGGPSQLVLPAFSWSELAWLGGLVERLRTGDRAALFDLRAAPLGFDPAWDVESWWVVRGLDSSRLRTLVVIAASALAWWLRTCTR